MTLGEKLQSIRHECGLSQGAIGAQGFVSAPGWIKLENGQRSPSEKLVEQFVGWLVEGKHIRANTAKGLRDELLTLKYLGSNSLFLRDLARAHARTLPGGDAMLVAAKTAAAPKAKPGKPKAKAKPTKTRK